MHSFTQLTSNSLIIVIRSNTRQNMCMLHLCRVNFSLPIFNFKLSSFLSFSFKCSIKLYIFNAFTDERITNLWTQSDETVARGYEDDGSMDFPSNEGALMTIGFLTFAVFLIKLVIVSNFLFLNKAIRSIIFCPVPIKYFCSLSKTKNAFKLLL